MKIQPTHFLTNSIYSSSDSDLAESDWKRNNHMDSNLIESDWQMRSDTDHADMAMAN